MALRITKPTGKRLTLLVLSFFASIGCGLVWGWYTLWPAVAFLGKLILMVLTLGTYMPSSFAHNDPMVEGIVLAGGAGAVLFAGIFVYLLFQNK